MAARRPARLGAATLFIVAAAFAVGITAVHALDIQGDDRLARLLTGPTTQQHWNRLSEQMMSGKTPLDDESLASLRTEAARNPLSAAPYFLTGASRKLKGDPAGGAKLVELAVRRDPRFLPARYWEIGYAAEHNRAADATDAALRVITLDPEAQQITIPILVQLTHVPESWPKIRQALAAGPTWRETYFNKLVEGGFEPSIVFSAIDVARETSGKPPDVREQNSLLASMVQKGDFERAYTAWLGWLPPEELAKVAYLYDGSFSGAPGAAPFNWTFASSADGAGVIDKEHGLRFDYSPSQNMQLAGEVVLLSPGRYRMTTFALLDEAMTQDAVVPLSWQLMCLSKSNIIVSMRLPDSTASKGVAGVFDVPADCPAQRLSLEGTAMEFPIRIGGYVRSLAIEKAK